MVRTQIIDAERDPGLYSPQLLPHVGSCSGFQLLEFVESLVVCMPIHLFLPCELLAEYLEIALVRIVENGNRHLVTDGLVRLVCVDPLLPVENNGDAISRGVNMAHDLRQQLPAISVDQPHARGHPLQTLLHVDEREELDAGDVEAVEGVHECGQPPITALFHDVGYSNGAEEADGREQLEGPHVSEQAALSVAFSRQKASAGFILAELRAIHSVDA
mmetsp:Transcript_12077/g.32611  ORF Transcript_12077/g.32611 Transcript_12077/m.32611 type:complete len:217 (-) Transcript_12077:321-971(-)